jgi:hypothetical protein
MPPNEDSTPLTGEIKAGPGMLIEQEAEANPVNAGDTASQSTNEEGAKPTEAAEEAATQEGKAKSEFVSGSRKARVLGESRRKLAGMLLQAARSSQDVREDLKRQCEESPDLEKYLQKHWRKDYEVVFKDRLESEIEGEELEMAEKAKMRAKAELLVEQLKEEKLEYAEILAADLHFTRSEANALKDLAQKLEGQKIGDEELTWDEAVKRAAYTIRPDKSKVGVTSLPAGMPAGNDTATQIKKEEDNDRLAGYAKKFRGAKSNEAVENLKIVEKGLRKDGVFQFPME